MKKIGISIPWDYFTGNFNKSGSESLRKLYPEPTTLLRRLKELGVSSIELRHRAVDMPASEMERVFLLLKNAEIGFSIHADNLPEDSGWHIETIFPWLTPLSNVFEVLPEIMVTLHPYSAFGIDRNTLVKKTVETLTIIQKDINNKNLPIRLALENQRSKGPVDPGTTFCGVSEMVRETGFGEIGVCWDMGHSTANNRTSESDFPLFPPDTFTSIAVHTHIHDLGPDGKTHWPIKEMKVPLAECVNLLAEKKYTGIYNLELSFERFSSEDDSKSLIDSSIKSLSAMINSA